MSKIGKRVKKENEFGARRAILEDLFYDFHSSRKQVYLFNFFRGIYFGVGSVIGATLIVALVLWILNFLVDIPGGVGEFVQNIRNTVQDSRTP